MAGVYNTFIHMGVHTVYKYIHTVYTSDQKFIHTHIYRFLHIYIQTYIGSDHTYGFETGLDIYLLTRKKKYYHLLFFSNKENRKKSNFAGCQLSFPCSASSITSQPAGIQPPEMWMKLVGNDSLTFL